ncbi:MAG: Ig-like domain-containing protein, partial [Bacteroidetes bacterium]|nr:Ig-like domain-containing protein [Bacteroidota bacterium]
MRNLKSTRLAKSSFACLFFVAITLFARAENPLANLQLPRSNKSLTEQIKASENSIHFIENKGQWSPDVKMRGTTSTGYMQIMNDHIHFTSLKKEVGNEAEEKEEEEKAARNESHSEPVEAHGWGIYFEGSNLNYTISKEKELITKYNYFINNDPSHHATDVSSYGETVLKDIYPGTDLRMYSQKGQTLEFDWVIKAGSDFSKIKMGFKGQDNLTVDEKGNLRVVLRFDQVVFDIPEAYQIINGKKILVPLIFEVEGKTASFKALGKVDSGYDLIIDPSLKWGTFFDGNSTTFDAYLFAVELDAAGNVLCGGYTNESIANTYTGTVWGYDSTFNSNRDGILYKLKADGTSLLKVTYLGGSEDDETIYGISLSPDFSTIYTTGYTQSDNFPLSATPFTNAINAAQDGFVSVFPAATFATLTYSSYLGGTGTTDEMVSIRGLSNNSFIVGGTVSAAVPAGYINLAYDPTYSGGTEMYIGKFTTFSTLAFGTYVGGTGDEQLNDLLVFSDGKYAFSGTSGATGSFPALINNVATGPTGGNDGVIGVIPVAGGNFNMLSRIGGGGDDQFFGITAGPFDTIFITGRTASTDFPLGVGAAAGNRFQFTKDAGNDGFLAKMPKTGYSGGGTDPWAATFFGGNGDDRGNTLRTYTPYAAMIFGVTQSSNYDTLNISDGGGFFDGTYNNGWDIFFTVLGTDLKTIYFSTYIGGTGNDYLGQTGTPHGSNHFAVEGDSLICLGTTVHSDVLTPAIVGPAGVFDITKTHSGEDEHLIFKWRIGIVLNFDYSDAPTSYGNPNHIVINSLKIGSTIDKEDAAQPSYKAFKDDSLGTTPDDEDGIAGVGTYGTQVYVQDTSTRFTQVVNVTNNTGVTAILCGWIDFNEDGDFLDANEVDTVLVPSAIGLSTATLTWTGYNATNIFRNAPNDTSYMRLRLTTMGGFFVTNPSPTLSASNGEVEDYMLLRYHCVNLTGATIDTNGTTGCGTATGSIVITNGNLLPGVVYNVYYSKNGGALQGPFSYTTAGITGTLTISGLTAGTYTAVEVFHPTNHACGFTLPGSYVILDPNVPSAPSPVTATPNPICTGGTVQFNATGQAGASWSWTGPVSFTSTLQNPTRSITSTTMGGVYSVTQTVAGCTSAAGTVTLTVVTTPIISSATGTNPTTCSGTQGTITLNGLTAAITYTVTYTKTPGGAQGPVAITANGSGQVIITGLGAGSYSNFVVSAGGCSSAAFAGPVVLTDPAIPGAPTGLTAVPNPVCEGGILTLSATGTALAWTFPGGGTASGSPVVRNPVTAAMGGTYSVTQTISGCTSLPATIAVTVNLKPVIGGSSSTNPTTCGGSQGTITLTGLSASVSYTVNYLRGVTPQTATITSTAGGNVVITGLIAGSYSNLTVTLVSSGCTSNALAGPIVLSDPSTPAAPAVGSNSPVCSGNAINLTATGAGGATYAWTGPLSYSSASQNPSILNATTAMSGSYCATQTVAGCTSASACVTVTVNQTPAITTTASSNPTTCSGTQGTITLNGLVAGSTYTVNYTKTPGGAQGPVSIVANGTGQVIITGLGAGSYSNFTVTILGCTSANEAGPIVLTDPAAPAAPTVGSNSPVCSGNNINLTATGVGSSFTWTGPSFSSNAQNPTIVNATTSMSGSYCATQTLNNCTSPQACTTVTVNQTPSITSTSSTNPTTCLGTQGTITLNGLVAASTYTVNYTKTPGGAQGPVSLTANGTGQIIISGLGAGSYSNFSVSILGCTSAVIAGPIVLTDPSAPAAPAVGSNSPVCSGNTINLTATGVGTSFAWTGPGVYTSASQNPTRPTSTTAMSGSYCATQTLAGCTSPQACVTVTVNQTPSITSTASTNPTTCSGSQGTITLNGLIASSTYSVTYDRNGIGQGPFTLTSNVSGQIIITGLNAGSYANFIVTINACPSAAVAGPIVLSDPSTPAAPSVGSNSPVCSGNTINLTATGAGGATYSWTGPSFSSSSQNPSIGSSTTAMSGSYCATQTVAGCTSPQACVTVTVNQTPAIPTASASPNPICSGNNLTLTAGGVAGATFNWSYPDGGGTSTTSTTVTRNAVTTAMSGTYTVTQTVTGCTSTAAGTVNVTVNATPVITSTASSNPTTCSGTQGTITLNGLNASVSYSIAYSRNGTAQGPFTITSNGTGQVIITGLNAGSYTNIIATLVSTGCPSAPVAGPIVLADPSTPAAPTVGSNSPVCSGNTINLTATGTGGATYSWTGPSYSSSTQNPFIPNSITAMSGSYCATQTVANCTSPAACVTVTVNQTPSISSTASSNPTTCSGSQGSITLNGLNASANYTYTYNKNGSPQSGSGTTNASGQLVISGLTAGSYTTFVVTLVSTGCPSAALSGPITLTDPATPAAPTVGSNSPVCSGNTINLTATGVGTSYSWTGPSFSSSSQNPSIGSATTAMSGSYCATQTLANCTSPAACVTVTVNQTPSISSTSSSNPTTCGGTQGTITLNGLVASSTYSVTYSRNGVAQGPFSLTANGSGQIVISGLNAGAYTNFVVSINGCPSSAEAGPVTLTDPTTPGAPTVGSNSPVCSGNTINLTATGTGGATYSWTGPSFTSTNQNPSIGSSTTAMSGSYCATQTVAGCTSIPACVTVTVNQTPAITTSVGTNPTTCLGNQGTITLSGLNASVNYTVIYNKNGAGQGPFTITTNGSGQLIITGLTAGLYNGFVVTLVSTGCPSGAFGGSVTLTDPANPIAPTLSSNSPRCYGDTLKLFSTIVSGATYAWTGPASFASALQNPTRPSAVPAMSGTYSVVVTVNNCNSSPATLSVTVTSCPPVAVNDSYTTPEDNTLNVPVTGVLVNDNDPANPQQPLTVTTTPVCNPSHGAVTLNANGSFSYVPAFNYNGLDSFCYRVCDNESPVACDTAVVFITVTPVNDPPIVRDTTVTTPEDNPITVCLPITDPETATQSHLFQSYFCNAQNGTVSSVTINNGSNPHTVCVAYTPNANFNGNDSVCIVICDNGSPQLCDTATIHITVTPVNDKPNAVDDYFVSCTAVAITNNVLTNDFDIDGPSITVTGPIFGMGPFSGTLTSFFANGTFTYTPPSGSFNGIDSFAYVICDGGTPNLCDTGVVVLDYRCVNVPPVADNDYYTIPEDQTLNADVSTNDYDPDGAVLNYNTTPLVNVTHGTLTLNGNGTFTYIPTLNYFGADSFTYAVCDTGTPVKCDTATVYITITPVNDPPVVRDTTITTPEDTPFAVCLPITDVESFDLHVSAILCQPTAGTLSLFSVNNLSNPHEVCVTYTPNANYNGLDSLCLLVCDNGTPSKCDTAYIRINVTPVNDPPIAVNDNYSTNEDVTLTTTVSTGVRINDNDAADGNAVTTLTITTTPIVNVAHGTLTLSSNGAFTYVPTSNYCGNDSFQYRVCDNGTPLPSLCDTGTAFITINCVNDPPVVHDTIITQCEDCGPITVCIPVTDLDAGQQHFVTSVFCGPNNGTVSTTLSGPSFDVLCVTYTPNANYNGSDSICIIVCDNGSPSLCDTTHISITVTPVNDPPVVVNDNYSTNEDVAIVTTSVTGVRNNDNDNADGNAVTTLTVTTTPIINVSNGTLVLNSNGSFTYTPNTNFNGVDSFQYRICDNGTPLPSLCDTATAYITVNPVNDPPVVRDTTVTTPEDNPISVCLPISDPESSDLHSSVILCNASNGSLSIPAVNNISVPHQVCITYTPNLNFNGTDSFCVIVCDNGSPSKCDTAIVHINVTPVNDPPVAVNDNYTTTEDVAIVTTSVTGVRNNDNDNADGNAVTTLTVNTTPVINVSNGTLVLNSNGSFTYTPNANFNGVDSFQYRVCDNGTPLPSLCDTATAYITVTGINDPPVVADTIITHCEDCGPITVCTPVTDPDNGQIHYISSTYCGPNNGTVSSTLSGPLFNQLCVTYTPNANFNGQDSICIIVCDNGSPVLCDTFHEFITVTPVNDPPVALNDNYTTTEDVTLTTTSATGVRNNDNDNADGNPVTSLTVNGTPILAPVHGTLTLNANGSFTYVPAPNYSGSDSFQYRVCDNGTPLPSLCDTATAYITISPVNDPPVVVDTPITQCEDCGPITVCIPVTDADVNTVTTIAGTFCGPNSGTVSTSLILNILCVTYTANANFNGLDSICIVVCDNGVPQLCDTTHIRITITPVNDPPIAINDNYNTNEDVALITSSVTGVRNNDNDNADGNPVTSLTVNTTPLVNVGNGTLVLNSNGSFTYTPNSNFSGTDSFQYIVCDNGTPLPSLCDTATAYITVNPMNDPPVVRDTTVTTPEDNPITVCLPITDPDLGQQHTVSICDVPDNGTITFGPVVNNGSLPHTVCITYRPNLNFNGVDSICLTICDNGVPQLCDNAVTYFNVTPVNDPPIATNDNYTTLENTTLTTTSSTGVRINDNDNADGNPVTSLSVNTTPLVNVAHGTLVLNSDGSFTYIPTANYNGTDSFQYIICDSGTPLPSLCDTATAYITITSVNYPPIVRDTIVTTPEDTPITVCIPISDQDALDTHTFSLCGSPVNGTATGMIISGSNPQTLCFTYTPYPNLNGRDSLCVIVCDNGTPQLCDTTHITIIITPVNDPPYADTIYVVTYMNNPVGVNTAAATGDLEGNPLTFSYGSVTPNNGTYGITGNGAIVVTPTTGFAGTFTIPYGVCDLSPYPVTVLCDSAVIFVTVLPPSDTLNNHAPIANNDYATTPLNNAVVINELANDYDVDGDPLSVTIIGLPLHGTVTVNPNGSVNYTPNTGYFGFDTIHYTICDPVGTTQPRPLCDDAYIIISISRDPESITNDPPVAVDDFDFICA